MSDRFTLRSAVYLILKKDGQILLSRRFNTGWIDGQYSLPSGHLEENEKLTDALVREAKEEIGISLNLDDIKMEHVFLRKSTADHAEYIDFFFTASKWEGDITNNEPDKCDDLKWFPKNNLPDNAWAHIKFIIEQIKKGNHFSEVGWSDK